MLYSCTHMATVGIKGLNSFHRRYPQETSSLVFGDKTQHFYLLTTVVTYLILVNDHRPNGAVFRCIAFAAPVCRQTALALRHLMERFAKAEA